MELSEITYRGITLDKWLDKIPQEYREEVQKRLEAEND